MTATGRPNSRPMIVKATVLAYDLAAAWIAMFAAVEIRRFFSPGVESADGASVLAATVFMLVCAIVFPSQKLHLGVWRFTALNDIIRILNSVAIVNFVFLLAMFLANRMAGVPRLSLVIEASLLIGAMIGARLLRQSQALGDWRAVFTFEDRDKPAAILAGRQTVMDEYLRDLSRRAVRPPFRVRGLIDVVNGERGRSIRGAPLLGGPREAERALISLSGEGGAPQLIIVDPELSRAQLVSLVRAASEAGAALVRAHQGGIGRLAATELTHIDAADLLSRPPRVMEISRPRAILAGKRVLVTGAGGTIGSELVRQISALDPARLVLVDSSEHALYCIDMELHETAAEISRAAYVADVRDESRMRAIMMAEKPQIVFHAAALKHVPLMEANPGEAVRTNVGGTMTTARLARDAGASAFVLISSDKAVHPTSVMGATKRAAELFVQAFDSAPGPMRAVAVRFGNVLGSNGSVLPLFERQIRAGGPITITHPETTRYFMTTHEAVALVLQAAALCDEAPLGGGVFVLDMGEPLRIEELARQLCRLRGRIPDREIQIAHIGLRPGEKMHESLFYEAETVDLTSVDGVLFAEAPASPLAMLAPRLDALLAAGRDGDLLAIAAALVDLGVSEEPDDRRERG